MTATEAPLIVDFVTLRCGSPDEKPEAREEAHEAAYDDIKPLKSKVFIGIHHLSLAERALVFPQARRGASQRQIAATLGRMHPQ